MWIKFDRITLSEITLEVIFLNFYLKRKAIIQHAIVCMIAIFKMIWEFITIAKLSYP